MAKRLIVDHMWCREETDEVGSDDVYMVVFHGRNTAPFNTRVDSVGPGNFWDDFDSGDDWSQDIVVSTHHPDSTYVIALVEKDDGKDITGGILHALKTTLNVVWKVAAASNPSKEARANAVVSAIQGFLAQYTEFPYGNDDLINVVKVLQIAPGALPILEFKGDGGRYRARFKVG